MADEKGKWVDAITKLTKLTQENKLKWSSTSSNNLVVDDDIQRIESVFLAEYGGKTLRLYKKRFKVEQPPSNSLLATTFILGGERKYPYWTSEIYLEIIDRYGHTLWTFPDVSALRDLFSAVKFQVSGVENLLKDLLNEGG